MKPYREYLRDAKHEYIVGLLHETRGSVTRAAQLGQVSRQFIYKEMARYGIEPPKLGRRFSRFGNAAWQSLR